MATAKRTPKVSRISRDRTLVAYARKQKPPPAGGGGEDGGSDEASPEPTESNPEDSAAATPAGAATTLTEPGAAATAAPEPVMPAQAGQRLGAGVEAAGGAPVGADVEAVGGAPVGADVEAAGGAAVGADVEAAGGAAAGTDVEAAGVVAPEQRLGAGGEAAARPPAASKPAEPARAHMSTVTMPVQASIGSPPAMPGDAAPIEAAVNVESAEDPTRMPGPREIPDGHPDDPAAPPGRVPPGDSRSMRRRADHHEFALVYRIQTYVISRFGVVGTRGQWRVVEYPTSASASHAYAKECSRFVSEGFSDYRA